MENNLSSLDELNRKNFYPLKGIFLVHNLEGVAYGSRLVGRLEKKWID